MDGNKDEAQKCLQIASDSIESGDRTRAMKFITKARRLDPSLSIDDLLSDLNASQPENKDPNQPAPENPFDPLGTGPRRRAPSAASSSSSSASATYTEDQVTIVREIKRKKDYYEILGVEKSCGSEDVRKAYRKLSLKVHPDKNSAPGAEEAFKKVSKAFQCLSNEESRKKYDDVGSDEPVYERRRGGGNGMRGFNGFYEGDVDADEIFRNFFFGGMHPATTANFSGFNFGPGVRVRTGGVDHSSSWARTMKLINYDCLLTGGVNKHEASLSPNSFNSWKIIHIPEKPPVSPHLQPTVDVLAAEIEPQHAHALVRKLDRIAPLENLRHVKRIRKLTSVDGGAKTSRLFVILYTANADPAGYVPAEVSELVEMYKLSTFTAKVCKYAASTKEEWEEQCKLWPTSFHPPTYNIDGITGFSEEDSLSVFEFMRLAVDMAKSGSSVVNAVVIVDLATRQIIATSCDQVCSNEMQEDSNLISQKNVCYENVSCLYPWGWLENRLDLACDGLLHPLRHAAIVAIENSAARDRSLYPIDGVVVRDGEYRVPCETESHETDTNVEDEGRFKCHGDGVGSDSMRPYLCTGYDIYFVWQPCIMCAMAIVHQRIRRVFYAFRNENDGALGSVHRLQGERSLNHHYAVFRVLMPDIDASYLKQKKDLVLND